MLRDSFLANKQSYDFLSFFHYMLSVNPGSWAAVEVRWSCGTSEMLWCFPPGGRFRRRSPSLRPPCLSAATERSEKVGSPACFGHFGPVACQQLWRPRGPSQRPRGPTLWSSVVSRFVLPLVHQRGDIFKRFLSHISWLELQILTRCHGYHAL